MGFDPYIRQKIRKLARQKRGEITEQQFYNSLTLKKYLERIGKQMTENRELSVSVCHDDPRGPIGCTSGNQIYLNSNSGLVNFFDNAEARFIAFMGVYFHEIAHCIFLDFNEERKAANSLRNGILYGEVKTDELSEDEMDSFTSMKKALEEPTIRPIFMRVFLELSNIVSDRHDEDALVRMYGSYTGEPIYAARHSLQAEAMLYEDAKAMVDIGQSSELVFFYDLILQMTRFNVVISRRPEEMENDKYWNLLMKIKKHTDIACVTDDTFRKYEELNSVMLLLWPFIRTEIEKLQERTQESENDQDGSNKQDDGDEPDKTESDEGQDQPQKLTQEQMQQIMNQLQQASVNAGSFSPSPQNRNSSDTAKRKRKEERKKQGKERQKTDSSSKEKELNNHTADSGAGSTIGSDIGSSDEMESALNNLFREIAENQAIEEIEEQASEELKNRIGSISQSDVHQDIELTVERELDVTDGDVERYNESMKELKPYSKRLQKQMLDALRDLQDGRVERHKSYGRNIVISDSYRPDQKYFSNKKAPQDLPEMAIYVLVDHSGSMCSRDSKTDKSRIVLAMEAAMLLHDFATGINIPVAVGGHCAWSDVRYKIYTDFEQISAKDKYRLAKMTTYGCNRDGMCLNIAANLLEKRQEQLKLLIIISDGLPNHSGYSGDIAKQDIQHVIKRCKGNNIDVLAAGIGDDQDQIRDIYGENFIEISDLSQLPKTLTNIVKKRVLAAAL